MTLVRFEVLDGHVGHLQLNDPERLNAMSPAMASAFEDAVQSARRAGLRALVLSGSGRAFSAGGDLGMLEERRGSSLSENRAYMLAYYRSFLAVRDLNVPLIAALRGHAVGAGACLACACDLRIATADTHMAFPFTRLGLHPGMGVTWFLPHLVGPARAADLLLTGRTVTADEALRIGLVNDIVHEDAVAGAVQRAADIVANGPMATELLLTTLRQAPSHLAQTLQTEATAQAVTYQTPEFAAGIEAARRRVNR